MSDNTQEIGLDVEYVKSIDSVCKIIEIVLSFVTFICACVWGTWWGGGWVLFVSITAFIIIAVFFVLKLFRIVYKLPAVIPVPVVELITCAVYTLFFLISGIVAAVKASWLPAIGAACLAALLRNSPQQFFSFASTLAFGADTFLKFQEWRSGGSTTTTTTTTTKTETTTVEQY